MEDKGNNRVQDIRIENFDVAYGNRCVGVCYCIFSILQNFIFYFHVLLFKVLCIDMRVAKFSSSVFVYMQY